MEHIVCTIHPFVIDQTIEVYAGGACIKATKCPLDEVKTTLLTLAREFNIKQIDLAGNQLYTLKLRDELVSSEYYLSDINITIY